MLNLFQHLAVNISEILNSYFTQSAAAALVQLRFQNDGNYRLAEGLLEVNNFQYSYFWPSFCAKFGDGRGKTKEVMLNLVQHLAVNISEILNSYFTQSAAAALVQLRFQNDGNSLRIQKFNSPHPT